MKQLLSFFVFLLLGCVKLSASTTNDFEMIAPDTQDAVSEYNFSHALLIPQDFIFTSVHITLEKESRNVFTTDNEKAEEEVPTSVRKPSNVYALDASVYFATRFVATSDAAKQTFQPRNYFAYYPSNTIQILLCTFRI